MLYTMWKGASLRAWVALGMTMAIVPLAASAVTGYMTLKGGVVAALQDIAMRQREEMDPTQRLLGGRHPARRVHGRGRPEAAG